MVYFILFILFNDMVHVGYFFCFLRSRPGSSDHLADEVALWGPRLCCLSHLNVDKVKKHRYILSSIYIVDTSRGKKMMQKLLLVCKIDLN